MTLNATPSALLLLFFNDDLEEEIYMKPPEGYKQYSNDRCLLYCLLLKALYDLNREEGSGTSSSVR